MEKANTRKTIEISTLVVIRDGRMLLVRKEGSNTFILPGGKIEAGESLEQAVRREVREEIGCEVTGLAYAAAFRDEAANRPDLDVLVHVHVGQLAGKPIEQAEIREIIWCDVENPGVPVAPSLSRQIFGYFQDAAAINRQLSEALREMMKKAANSSFRDKHLVENLVQASVALGDLTPAEASMEMILMPMRQSHQEALRKIKLKIADLDKTISAIEKSSDQNHPDLSGEDRERNHLYLEDLRERRANFEKQISLGEKVGEKINKDPSSVLIPLGTLVRTRKPDVAGDDWPMPVEGSLGVVVGYSTTLNRPNVVAFIEDVRETSGEVVLFDEDEANRLYQVNYLPEELEIIEAGSLVDGTPVTNPGWWPTHSHHEKGSILYSESMVVRGGGRLWRIQPCSLLPECTQITPDTEEGRERFSHLIPLERENQGENA